MRAREWKNVCKHYLMSIQIDSQQRDRAKEKIQFNTQKFVGILGEKETMTEIEKEIDGKLKIKFLRRTFFSLSFLFCL